MNQATLDEKKTEDSRDVEALLRPHFDRVECDRYNWAALRLCIFEERFRPLSQVQRHELVEPYLQQLPESLQEDLIFMLLLAAGEENDVRYRQRYLEFIDPSPSEI